MSARLDEFGDDLDVVMVTFTDEEHHRRYLARHALAFPVVRDPERTAYRTYGLGRASSSRVWGVRAARSYLDLFRRTNGSALRNVRAPREDPRQLGGDFVIDADGLLRWGFWGKGPDDRPSVDDLLGAVTAARTQ